MSGRVVMRPMSSMGWDIPLLAACLGAHYPEVRVAQSLDDSAREAMGRLCFDLLEVARIGGGPLPHDAIAAARAEINRCTIDRYGRGLAGWTEPPAREVMTGRRFAVEPLFGWGFASLRVHHGFWSCDDGTGMLGANRRAMRLSAELRDSFEMLSGFWDAPGYRAPASLATTIRNRLRLYQIAFRQCGASLLIEHLPAGLPPVPKGSGLGSNGKVVPIGGVAGDA